VDYELVHFSLKLKMGVQLDKIFDAVAGNTIFNNKFILQTNHSPENIPHRDKQIEQVASILAPALRGDRTSNLFIYGQTGTGKTLTAHYVKNELMKRAEKENLPLKIEYLNCKLRKVSDTEYRILAELIKKLGGSVPATGLPTEQVYNKFIEIIEKDKKAVILILDEVDQAVRKISDNFLYNLTRLNSELSQTHISLVGISNDLKFLESLDPRVRSSLGEEEIVFSPYNALQLQEILKDRAEKAFKTGILEDGVISKCAAYAAREHGDARRALDLLRIAGELAEREGSVKVKIEHVDKANEKIDRDKILDIVESAPKQFQIALLSIIQLTESKESDQIFTGDVYNIYNELCQKCKTEILTQRRVSDIIAEIDMLGLINARVVSKGRHGRTKEIKLSVPENILAKVKALLNESLEI
jgi:cell division control protein 6